MSTINKIHLKCCLIDGPIVDALRQPILNSLDLGKPPGYKMFCEPQTIQSKKVNKSVLNFKTLYSEDDSNEEVIFNQETLTFPLQIIERGTNKGAFKNLKVIVFVLEEDRDPLQQAFMVT